MELKNYMEILMWYKIDELIEDTPEVCHCEKCRFDIAALAMNFLPPRYIVTDKGRIFTNVKTLEQQFTIDIITALTHAITIVKSHPQHVSEADE
jgi:competence protein ComFB